MVRMAYPGHAGTEGVAQLSAWLRAAETRCAQFAGQGEERPAMRASAGRSSIIFVRSSLDDVMSSLPPSLQPSFAAFPAPHTAAAHCPVAVPDPQAAQRCEPVPPRHYVHRHITRTPDMSPTPDFPPIIHAACPQGPAGPLPAAAYTAPMTPVSFDSLQSAASSSSPAPDAATKKKRTWSEADKQKHSQACKSKSRLTLAEKLEIIRLFESPNEAERKSQKELAVMFGKSRMTISTVLRADSVAWYKQLAEGGVRAEAKRCKRFEHPDIERLVFKALGAGKEATTKASIISLAEAIARQQNIDDFVATNNWCTRFIQQHDIQLVKHTTATTATTANLPPSTMPHHTTSSTLAPSSSKSSPTAPPDACAPMHTHSAANMPHSDAARTSLPPVAGGEDIGGSHQCHNVGASSCPDFRRTASGQLERGKAHHGEEGEATLLWLPGSVLPGAEPPNSKSWDQDVAPDDLNSTTWWNGAVVATST